MGAHPSRACTLAMFALLVGLSACPDGPNPAYYLRDGGPGTDSGSGNGGASAGSGGAAAGSGGRDAAADVGGNEIAATSSLIGYWRLDDGPPSTTAADSSGRGHHGILVSLDPATVWTAGTVGTGALTLAQTPGSGVRIPWTREIDDLRAFTIAAWITRVISPVHKAVFSRQLNATDQEIFTISAQNDEVIVFIPGTGSQVNREVRAAVSTPATAWLHVGATYDGSALRLYLNGALAAEKLSFSNRLVSAPNDLYIGNNFNANQNEPYRGSIDEVVLFSRALPPDKIAALASRASPVGLD